MHVSVGTGVVTNDRLYLRHVSVTGTVAARLTPSYTVLGASENILPGPRHGF